MTLRILITATCLSATLGGAALAACPGRADMARATVKITDQNDGVGLYTHMGKGKVYEEYDPDQESGFWVESLFGIYVLRDGSTVKGMVDPASTRTLTYKVPLDQLPGPDQPGTYTFEATATSPSKPQPETEKIQVTIGAMGKFSVGICSYDSRLITLVTDFADGTNSLAQISYLPELQIGFYHAFGTREDGLTDYYRPRTISIELK